MNEAPDAEREPAGYIRLPWPLVAGGLFLFLAVLFAFGLFANRNLRPQLTVAPTAVVVGEAQTPGLAEAATPTALVGAPPTPVGTATPQPAAVATATLAATATSVSVMATATAEAAAAARLEPSATPAPVLTAGTATIAAGPTREAAATPRPTVSPELAAEVGHAYKQYWDVRAEALYELDGSRLEQVMAGDHLAAVQKLISELIAEGHAIETKVDHKYVVLQATTNSAQVADSYIDDSVYVDAQTGAAISSPTGERLTELYSLTKIDGTWRVVDLVRGA